MDIFDPEDWTDVDVETDLEPDAPLELEAPADGEPVSVRYSSYLKKTQISRIEMTAVKNDVLINRLCVVQFCRPKGR